MPRVLAVLALLVSGLSAIVAQAPAATAGRSDLATFNGGRPLFDGSPPVRSEAVTIRRDGIVAAGTGWRNDQMDMEVVRYTNAAMLDGGFGAGAAVSVAAGAFHSLTG